MSLQETYTKKVAPELKKKLGLPNVNAVPKIVSVHVNVGIGTWVSSGKDYEDVVKNITAITGQKPVVVKSKKAISNFKLKINMATGVLVTLRGRRMYDFLEKLIGVVFPRIRDFRGVSTKAFDGNGNYSIGIKEHGVFPEIHGEDINKTHGVQINIRTTATTDEHARELLTALGFPFKKPLSDKK